MYSQSQDPPPPPLALPPLRGCGHHSFNGYTNLCGLPYSNSDTQLVHSLLTLSAHAHSTYSHTTGTKPAHEQYQRLKHNKRSNIYVVISLKRGQSGLRNWRLWYLVCMSFCVCVCLHEILALQVSSRHMSDTNGFSGASARKSVVILLKQQHSRSRNQGHNQV